MGTLHGRCGGNAMGDNLGWATGKVSTHVMCDVEELSCEYRMMDIGVASRRGDGCVI
jgi:hypothetical protein